LADRIGDAHENDWNGVRLALERSGRGGSISHKDVWLCRHQLNGIGSKSFSLSSRLTNIDSVPLRPA
jgi:hypothetical protein